MAKGRDEEIKDLATSWEDIAGDRVEEFIKRQLGSRVGYIIRSQEKGEDGCYHLYGFVNEEAYNEWNSDPEGNAELLLTDVALPDTGGSLGSTSYVLGLYRDGSGDIVTTDNRVRLRIRFTSEMYNPISQSTEDTSEGGVMTVQTRLNTSSSWTTRGTLSVPSIPAAEKEQWTTVDLTEMLSVGTQQVRLIVKGEETQLNTRYLQFSVTKTTLGLVFASQWEKPVTDGVMRLQFYISGAVSKTLHLRVDGARETSVNIGTSVFTETPRQIDITDADTDVNKVITHGVHEIEAWLTVNDSTVESEHIRCQVMVVTEPEDTKPYLILNEVNDTLTNWTMEHILSYALYNPAGGPLPLKFILTDYKGEDDYMTLDVGNVTPGVQYSLDNVIEIESDYVEIGAYMKFLSGGSELHEMIGFTIDNSENFAPTANADFILNPKSRTNAEDNPLTVVNQADGSIVPSTWNGFGLVADGWTQDESGNKCLRVPAGRSLEIDYESFTGFIGTDNHSSLTVELDLATRNATDMEDALLRMCSYLGGDLRQPLGFELKPTQAAMLTSQNREYADQDVLFQEGVRTHIALNIIYGINGSSQNYIRIFINGIINREFLWEPSDEFVQYVGSTRTSQGIRIGSGTCDIDVYGIRVYKRSLSASDIMQDYMASLATVAEKTAFREMNDILDDANHISYSKARERYNTIVITGEVPSYKTGNIKTVTDWEVNTIGDPKHSGKLTNQETSGQGTSSRSYWLWNLQAKFTDTSRFVNLEGEEFDAFALDDTVPFATKNVAKRNWASSQQSHKMGSCNLFTDLWRRCTGGSSITSTEGFEKCRPSVKQKPYLMFIRKSEGEEPEFYGQYTFGPGKGDKPTFGYDKKVFPDYLMIEGCDNGEPLTNHRIPWNDDITIGGDEDELINYNGRKQWEIDMGNSASLHYFKDAFNFFYEHNPHIEPFIGDLAALQKDNTLNRQHLYWVTVATGTESARYDLYRWDELTEQWVDAGVEKLGAGKYAKLNLSTQTGVVPSGVMWDQINEQFKAARVRLFSEGIGGYVNLKDGHFCQMFLKLIGASDNRAKNTYMYLAEVGGKQLIHFAQDDLDTIFTTDNVGRKNKPYYVEEHDRDADGGTYWNGEENALYDLMELAFPTEQRAMMNSILSEMANLATDHSVFGCFDDYYFSTQKYFPAVVYNETARISYEAAAQAVVTGEYTPSTHPLTQSLGDQLQGEMQWVRLRVVYMSSFASFGQFAMNGEGSLTWRSATKTDGGNPDYTFRLVPHMWLYPAVSAGSSTLYGRGNAHPKRVKAGELFVLDGVQADNDTNIQLHGIHFFNNIGDFGDKSLTGTFTVAGERLTEFTATAMPKQWRPTALLVTAPLLRKFDINGAATVTGSVNFGVQKRLAEIDLRGTSISSFSVAEPTIVTSLHLPATLTSLTLRDYKALTPENFSIEGASRLQTLVFSGCPQLSSQIIVSQMCASEDTDLHEVRIDDVNWTAFPVEYLLKLGAIGARLNGEIALATAPTFEQKMALVEYFGNIDDPSNTLHVLYSKVYLTSVELTGDSYYGEPGEYKLAIIPSSARANDFTKIEWSMTANSVGATIDPVSGLIRIPRIGNDIEKPSATVSVKVTTSDGSNLASSMQVWFYHRDAEVGDYVYADGSYSDILNKLRTVIGVCFYIHPLDKTKRLCVALKNIDNGQWGLNPNDWSGGITLQDNPQYSPFSVKNLANITSSGLTGNTVNDANLRTGDDFKEFDPGLAMSEIGWRELTVQVENHMAGEMLPYGFINTINIVVHRNVILNDGNIQMTIPHKTELQSKYENLLQLMNDAVSTNGNQEKYRGFYYPAASLCNAYEPKLNSGESLSPKFMAGSWWLPSVGEFARVLWYHQKGYEAGAANAIFAKAVEDGIMTPLVQGAYWTSTQYTDTYAWIINAYNNVCSGMGNGKGSPSNVRPVVAF